MRDAKTKRLIPVSWNLVSEAEQQQLVDRIVVGPNGIAERLASSAAASSAGDKAMAELELRRAAIAFALVKQLGFDVTGMEREIKRQAALLGFEVV